MATDHSPRKTDDQITTFSTSRFSDAYLSPVSNSIPMDVPTVMATPLLPLVPGTPNNPTHFHDCFEVMWFSGEFEQCTHFLGDTDIRVKNGELHIVPFGLKHRVINVDNTVSSSVKLDFSWDALSAIASESQISAMISFSFLLPWMYNDVHRLIFAIPDDFQHLMTDVLNRMCILKPGSLTEVNPQHTYTQPITALFREFLNLFESAFSRTLTQKDAEICGKYAAPMIRVLNYIGKNYSGRITLDDICSVAGFKTSWFSRIFREIFGFQVMEYVNFIRIYNARALLTNTPLHVHDISEMCGFNSTIYFDRIFKEFTGCTPKHFRTEYEYYL